MISQPQPTHLPTEAERSPFGERSSLNGSTEHGDAAPVRHPVFADFPPYQGRLKRGFGTDYIGSMTRPEYLGSWAAEHDVEIATDYPPVDEELFEWIELLESVRDAGSNFTYVELGAGFGRWTARAVQAARQRGIAEFRAVLVEAEPQHAQWARQHMDDNGLSPDHYVLYEAAVGARAGQATFAVEMPGEPRDHLARDWYGQALMSHTSNDRVSGRSYHGKPVLERDDGYHSIQVETITLDTVLAALDYVNLVDMDIQYAEADVIEASLPVLAAKVGRLSVGTHHLDLHERVRVALIELGWIECWNYRPGLTEATPYGPVSFRDGVSSWINPRFSNRPLSGVGDGVHPRPVPPPFAHRLTLGQPGPQASTAHLFVVHSNGCTATAWTAKVLNAHPEILCLHAANIWIREIQQHPFRNDAYLEQLLGASDAYQAVGDVHGIGREEIPGLKARYGSDFTSVALVRDPIARLRSMVSLFTDQRARGFRPISDVEYVHGFAESCGIAPIHGNEDAAFFLHAAYHLNDIVYDQTVGTIYRCEDVTTKPAVLATLIEEVTAGRVIPTRAWIDEVIQLAPVNVHRTAGRMSSLDDWQIDVLRKIVAPEAWTMYRDLGYDLPDFLD